jgi:hypothetical protein
VTRKRCSSARSGSARSFTGIHGEWFVGRARPGAIGYLFDARRPRGIGIRHGAQDHVTCEKSHLTHDAFNRAFNRLTPARLQAINRTVVQAAVQLGLEEGKKLRVDTTVDRSDIERYRWNEGMTRFPGDPDPALKGKPRPESSGISCSVDCALDNRGFGSGNGESAALGGIHERNTHRRSASTPCDHRRFVDFLAIGVFPR